MKEVFLGDYIRQKRIERGLSQQELCEGICDHGTLSRLENGRQTPPEIVSSHCSNGWDCQMTDILLY